MAKLSQQLKEQGKPQSPTEPRLTRTQRVLKQQQTEKLTKEFQTQKRQAEQIMSKVTPETYEKKYSQLSATQKKFYISPSEYKQLPDVKSYLQKKTKYDRELKSYQEKQYQFNLARDIAMGSRSGFALQYLDDYGRSVYQKNLSYWKGRASGELVGKPTKPSKTKGISPASEKELIELARETETLKKGASESEASYQARLLSLGRSYQADPNLEKSLNRLRNIKYFDEQKQRALADWQSAVKEYESKKEKPSPKQEQQFYVLEEGKDLPYGYGGQQSISSEPRNVVLTKEQYDKIQSAEKPNVIGGIAEDYNKFVNVKAPFYFSPSAFSPKKDRFKFSDLKSFDFYKELGLKGFASVGETITGSPFFKFLDPSSSVKVIKTSDTDIPVPVLTGNVETKLIESSEKEQQAFTEKNLADFTKEFEESSEKELSEDFYLAKGKEIIEGKEPEIAKEEYLESQRGKEKLGELEEKYASGYKETYGELPTLTRLGYEAKQSGRAIIPKALNLIDDPATLGLTIGAGYGAVKTASLVPAKVWAGVEIAELGYGSYKLAYGKEYGDALEGAVWVGFGGAGLTARGVKYWKSPDIRTVKLKPPKPTVYASQTKAYDLSGYVDDALKQGSKTKLTLFPEQKLSQIGVWGRRTIVTTKGKRLFENIYRNLGVSEKSIRKGYSAPIYQGVPTRQPPTSYKVEGLRGSFSTTFGKKSGYQKAFDLLKKYGYSDTQARATLRYTAPRVYENYLKSGAISIKGGSATGRFEYLTKRPVITTNQALGIKTRGGKDIIQKVRVDRNLMTDVKTGQKFIFESKSGAIFSKDLKGLIKLKQLNAQLNIGVGASKDISRGFDVFPINKQFKTYKVLGADIQPTGVAYQNILDLSAKNTRGILDVNLKTFQGTQKANTLLIRNLKEISKGSNVLTPAKITKTPLSKTFSQIDKTDDIFKTTSYGKQSSYNKVLDKLDDSMKQFESKWAGTGLYERTDVTGYSKGQLTNIQSQLSTPPIPSSVKISQVKNLILPKFAQQGATLSLSALGLSSALKSDLKLDAQIKTDLRTETTPKTDTIQKTDPILKNELKSALRTSLDLAPPITTPTTTTPKIPRTPVTPRIPVIPVIPWLPNKIGISKGFGKKRTKQELGYLPDFTSRALGLKPEKISQAQAKRKLKEILTGFELRRGVVIE